MVTNRFPRGLSQVSLFRAASAAVLVSGSGGQGKGTNGVSTNRVTAISLFFVTGIFLLKVPGRAFFLNLSKFIYFCSGPISVDSICPQPRSERAVDAAEREPRRDRADARVRLRGGRGLHGHGRLPRGRLLRVVRGGGGAAPVPGPARKGKVRGGTVSFSSSSSSYEYQYL